MTLTCENILKQLKSLSNPEAVAGMARFGIDSNNTYGVSIPTLRKIAKDTGKNHSLALKLWSSGIHEARLLAGMIDSPEGITEEQMESWVKDFNSWDVCDQVCSNLFDKTEFAYKKAVNWALRQIGKRNTNLNKEAIKTAKDIRDLNSKSAKWIASDAIRELTGEAVQKKLHG